MTRLALGAALLLVFGAGQFFKDRTHASALIFYVPAPMVAAGVGALAFWPGRRPRGGAAVVMAAYFAAPVAVTLFVDNHPASHPQPVPAGTRTFRVVHWNVAYAPLGVASLAARLRPLDPDFLMLTEFPHWYASRLAAALGGGRSVMPLDSMCFVARGHVSGGRWLSEDSHLQVFGAVWDGPAGPIRVMAVNLASSLHVRRDPLLQAVRSLLVSQRPDLTLGDFNAPRRSRALDPLPPDFLHAYDAAGGGWSYSWPVPLPLLAIDQMIVGPRLVAVSYRLRGTLVSDHRMQVLDFTLAPEATQGQTPTPLRDQGQPPGHEVGSLGHGADSVP